MIIFNDSVEINEGHDGDKSIFEALGNNYEDLSKAMNINFDWDKQEKEKNESLLDENHHQIYCLNCKPKIQSETLFLIEKNENKITKPTTLTNQIKKAEDIKLPFALSIKPEENDNNKPKKLLCKKRGRKNNNPEKKKKVEHDKYSQDNMMRKIKTNLLDYIVNYLNESLEDKTFKFYKISSDISENLKKDFNIALMKRTLYDIFKKTKLSNKYRKKKHNNFNSSLIDKIYKEKTEIKTIEILEKKYIEIINEIKENNLKEFMEKIEEKEKIDEAENFGIYIKSLEELFKDYENWFESKRGRASRKSKNN